MLTLTPRHWIYLGNNTERVGSVLRGIWLESWPKAHDPDWILRTCNLIDFMVPFVPKCVVELLALLLPFLKFFSEWLVLLRILKLQIPGGCLDIFSDTWPVFSLGQPKQNAGTVITCFKILSSSAFQRHRIWSNPGGVQIFQKFRSNFKILGPGRVTRGKFDISSDPALRTCVPVVC
jgi:hypothetical protein